MVAREQPLAKQGVAVTTPCPLRAVADRPAAYRQRPAGAAQLAVRAQDGGTYVLRLDDTDAARSTEEFARGIEDDLGWLGIVPHEKVRQSDRTALYDAARDRLIAAGRLYPAYETEDELEIKRGRARLLGKPPIYDRAALALTEAQKRAYAAEGRKPHWRFRLDGRPVQFDDLIKGPQTVNTASMSDPVLIRADGTYLYTLPSVVDDIDLGITHVIRGEDHVTNTGTQIEIFEALGGRVPIFAHHNLLTGAEGEGLSKRLGSLSLSDLRDDGFEALAVATRRRADRHEPAGRALSRSRGAGAKLDLSMVSHGPARFDPAELESLNARLLHAMPYETARPRLPSAIGGAAWTILRGNLTQVLRHRAVGRRSLSPNRLLKPAAEDRAFLAKRARAVAARALGRRRPGRNWTEALKAADRPQGQGAVPPAAAGAHRARGRAGA